MTCVSTDVRQFTRHRRSMRMDLQRLEFSWMDGFDDAASCDSSNGGPQCFLKSLQGFAADTLATMNIKEVNRMIKEHRIDRHMAAWLKLKRRRVMNREYGRTARQRKAMF